MRATNLTWFLGGVVAALGIFFLILFISLKTRVDGFSALDRPGGFEAWIAGTAMHIARPSGVAQTKDPLTDSPDVLADGRAHFADHCTICHANNGSGDNEIGSRLYPRPPDLRRRETQSMTDGELFYIIEKGVRWSGMPGWQGLHSDEDNWKLVRFIRHLPNLSEAEIQEMEKLNPKGPDEWEEQQQEEQFLKGRAPSKTPIEHHHH